MRRKDFDRKFVAEYFGIVKLWKHLSRRSL